MTEKNDNRPQIYYGGPKQKQVQMNYQRNDRRGYIEQDQMESPPIHPLQGFQWVPISRQHGSNQNWNKQVGYSHYRDHQQNRDTNHWQHGFSDSMKTSNWQYSGGNDNQGKVWHGYDKGKNPWV